jgi:hypothetical protein
VAADVFLMKFSTRTSLRENSGRSYTKKLRFCKDELVVLDKALREVGFKDGDEIQLKIYS